MLTHHKPLDIVVVGAGIGGLTAAIACRRASPPMNVTVLERCPEILTVGAGIHIPPNGCRILTEFGLLDKLKQAGGYEVGNFKLLRYADGRVLASKPLRGRVQKEHNAEWMYVLEKDIKSEYFAILLTWSSAIHRGDYQRVLLEEAAASGANILTHAEAIDIESKYDAQTSVLLKDGRTLLADVVIGADGKLINTN